MGARVIVERLEELRARQEGYRSPTFAEFTQLVDEVSELRAVLGPVRALGAPVSGSVRMAATLFASGATEKQVSVFSKAVASGVLGVGEQLLLREEGTRVVSMPEEEARRG